MPISEEKQKAASKAIGDSGLSPDMSETLEKVVDTEELSIDDIYNDILNVRKAIKVLKDTFGEDYPHVAGKLIPVFRQHAADNDPRQGNTDADDSTLRLYATGPLTLTKAPNFGKQEKQEEQEKQEKQEGQEGQEEQEGQEKQEKQEEQEGQAK
ncbi:hypothetical protein V494_03605 [Pseudogymnoascus sp. VKM F-4513 (FW-928)]|nr:hypothetical protein V494_03605 [Pseudogymnoascus sp. VKM F-4513 (FW-928)]